MRFWQVNFHVYKTLDSLPYPGDMVEEIQESPDYRQYGCRRASIDGGQLVLTLKGTGGFKLGKREFRLKPGMAFLALHADPAHSYFYPPEGTEPWIFFWIAMHGKAAENMITEMVERYGYFYNLASESGIIKRLYSYKQYQDRIHLLTPLAGARLVMDVLTSLGDDKENELVNEPVNNLIISAQEYIFKHISADINVNDVATFLRISREHLSRIFKEQTGISPYNYILNQKIRLACNLLSETKLSCKEVGVRVGIENPVSFTRSFKRIVNLSPGEFRASPSPDSRHL
jgi:AraC-like DNA-binding protein